MNFFRRWLKRIKLFVLYWTRIVFVENHFSVHLLTKLRCNFRGGFLADQYVLYDLKHNDKKDYLSEFDWYRSRYINEPFDFAFNNKVVCAEILRHYIHTAENFYIKNKGILYDFNGHLVQSEDVFNCIIARKKLIIKPFALGKGNGVHLLCEDGGRLYLDEAEITRHDLHDFLLQRDEFIISEYIEQHPYAAEIYDKTANTIRLITLRDIENHKMKMFFAVQRIGTSQTVPVDNGSKGGLVCKIDIETGALSSGRTLRDMQVYEMHPDSGKKLEGIVIPNWGEVKSEVLAAAEKLPYMDFIAWDILITDTGPCVIEANASSGVNILQLWGGQRNGELGKFFRHYGVIK